MTKVALIIADPSLLKRLQNALHLQPGIVCLAAATNMASFWNCLPQRGIADIIFVDNDLPGQNGNQTVCILRKQFPHAELILLVTAAEGWEFIQAVQKGATGVLKKGFSEFSLPKMIQTIQNGGALLSPVIAKKLVEYFKNATKNLDVLSPSEEQLLRLFYEGKTYKESASLLGISVDGVKYHVKNIYRKLDVNKKVDALRIYREHMESN